MRVEHFTCTKAADVAIVYEQTPAAVVKVLWCTWIRGYFVPAFVISYKLLDLREFAHLLARLGITHRHPAAAHPASNVAVERVVNCFKDMLSAHLNAQPVHWVQSVAVVRMHIGPACMPSILSWRHSQCLWFQCLCR